MRELLTNHYGADAPFLQQVQDGVEGFVHRCIEQLGSPGPTGNASPIQLGTDYRMPARTAEQFRQEKAADERAVRKAPNKGSELAVNEDVEVDEIERRGELASPLTEVKPVAQPAPRKIIVPKKSDWAL